MLKGELFSAHCVKNRAAESQDSVLTADNFPKIFLAGIRMAVLGRLPASLKQNHPGHVLLNSA